MKRSRIFLGLTTACLAIAGVVAAKVSYFGSARTAWFQRTTTQCVLTQVTCVYDNTQTPICTINGFNVYTQKDPNVTSNACKTLLKYKNI